MCHRHTRVKAWREEEAQRTIEERGRDYDPSKDPNVEGDPYRTLFVGRLSFEVTERKLMREFEEYGPIKSIRLVQNKAGRWG